jgi:signal transduction histidine kinase
LAGANADGVLELIAERALELVAAEQASVALLGEGGGSLLLKAVSGANAEQLRGKTFPLGHSVSGAAIASGRLVISEDLSADPRAFQPVVRAGEMGPAVFVPLIVAGEAFGTLGVVNLRHGRVFSEADIRLIEMFAAQAAVAIEYARTHEELRRLLVVEDRERIARELHDGAIQSLFAVAMGLKSTGAILGDEDVRRKIEQAVEEIDRVIADLRSYIFGLKPGILAGRRLDQALHDLAQDLEDKTGIVAAVEIDEPTAAMLSSREGDLVSLAREALSNVGRHSGAETCALRLHRDNGFAVLEIDDDGRGFDAEAAAVSGSGNGLRNIRERAGSLGGDAEIESSDSGGTTVRVLFPV